MNAARLQENIFLYLAPAESLQQSMQIINNGHQGTKIAAEYNTDCFLALLLQEHNSVHLHERVCTAHKINQECLVHTYHFDLLAVRVQTPHTTATPTGLGILTKQQASTCSQKTPNMQN